MRLAGLAVLALALVGTLVLLGQNGAFDDVWERATGERVHRVTNPDKTVLTSLDIEGTSVFGAPTAQDSQVILSGFPSYAGLKFDLPVDARPLSGTLNIDFTSLVAEDVEGALRVSVNGQKRADFLLLQGDKKNALQIELTGADLSSGTISVGLSLQGRGPIAQCSVDDAIAAVVNISGGTGLRLELDRAVETTRDRLALWGNRVPINWTSNLPEADAAAFLQQTALLESKGYRPIFTSRGVDLDELSTIAAQAQSTSFNSIADTYPIALTSNPANQGAKTFTRRASWRYSYTADGLPDQKLPAALDLRMKVGPAADEVLRDVTVSVNDRFLLSRRIGKGVEQFNQSIAIPAALQQQSNTLEISITAHNPNARQCDDIPQSVAELLPETVLRSGNTELVGPLQDVVSLLVEAGDIALDANNANPEELALASHLLSALQPESWTVSANATEASIQIITARLPIIRSQLSAEKSHWLIYDADGPRRQIIAKRIAPDANSDSLVADGNALLISIDGFIPLPLTAQEFQALELMGAL